MKRLKSLSARVLAAGLSTAVVFGTFPIAANASVNDNVAVQEEAEVLEDEELDTDKKKDEDVNGDLEEVEIEAGEETEEGAEEKSCSIPETETLNGVDNIMVSEIPDIKDVEEDIENSKLTVDAKDFKDKVESLDKTEILKIAEEYRDVLNEFQNNGSDEETVYSEQEERFLAARDLLEDIFAVYDELTEEEQESVSIEYSKLKDIIDTVAGVVDEFGGDAKQFAVEEHVVYVSNSGNDNAAGTAESPYATLQKAQDNVQNNGTIILLSDLEVGKPNSLTSKNHSAIYLNKEMTIKSEVGQTYSIHRKEGGYTMLQVDKGSVLLENVILEGNGKNEPEQIDFIYIKSGATLTLGNGAKIQDVCIQRDGEAGFGWTYGFAIILNQGKLVMEEGSSLSNLTASAGCVRLSKSEFVMNGGLIENCDSTYQNESNAVLVSSNSTFTMHDGKITGSMGVDGNGTIYLHDGVNNKFIMDGGEISGNKAKKGGGVFVSQGSVTISGDAKIYDNLGADDENSNVYLKDGQMIRIGNESMSAEASIGVYVENPPTKAGQTVAFADEANEEDMEKFFSDNTVGAGVVFKDKKLYLAYDAREYFCKVIFDSNGGSLIDSITEIVKGTKISAPSVPEKEGFVFAGWYKDHELTTTWDFEKDVVEEDITLYAKWNTAVTPTEKRSSSSRDSYKPAWYINTDGTWKYRLPNGTYARSTWQHVTYNGQTNWYYFDVDAEMKTGWLKTEDLQWYYLNPKSDGFKGAMVTGLFADQDDGNVYYLNESTGLMETGWVEVSGKWYYFNPNPPAYSGWIYDEATKQWVYENKEIQPFGAMLKNTTTPDGKRVGADGARID